MASDNVPVTAGSGTSIATDDVSSVHFQKIKVDAGGDGLSVPIIAGAQAAAASLPVANATEDVARVGIITEAAPATDIASSGLNGRLQRIAQRITSLIALVPAALSAAGAFKVGVVDLAGTAVDSNSGSKSAGTLRVVLATDQPALTNKLLVTPDSVALPANQSVNAAQLAGTATSVNSGTKDNGTLRVVLATDQPQLTNKLLVTPDANSTVTITAAAAAIAKAEDVASVDADVGVPAMAVRKATPANTSGTDGDYEMLQMLGGRLYVRGEPRMFFATFATMTRPANTTAYAANDAVSNNGTAGSVTAQTATISDVNDDPFAIDEMLINTTDTGVAAKAFRAHLYRADPTTSSGIVNGDNGAFSTKRGSWIGSMSGVFQTFSDGSMAVLAPDSAQRLIVTPVSGAATLFILFQTLDAFTPSANSTTFIATVSGIQGRA